MARHLTEAGVAARQKSDRAVGIARRMRKQMTPAEKALWFELRRLEFDGSHFPQAVTAWTVHRGFRLSSSGVGH